MGKKKSTNKQKTHEETENARTSEWRRVRVSGLWEFMYSTELPSTAGRSGYLKAFPSP